MIKKIFIAIILIAAATFTANALSHENACQFIKKNLTIDVAEDSFEDGKEKKVLKDYLKLILLKTFSGSRGSGFNTAPRLPSFISVSHHFSVTGVDTNRSLTLLFHCFLFYDHS